MRIRIIDAFADRPFEGNPAAVVVLDAGRGWPDEAWMSEVGREMNLPMTAFVGPAGGAANGGGDRGLRWFMASGKEQEFCGHATLAAAHALAEDRGGAGTTRFDTLSGTLVTHVAQDGAVTLDFPAATTQEAPVPQGLAAALGAEPQRAHTTGTLRDVLAIFPAEADVRALAPDMAALAAITERDDIRGITATAPAEDPDTAGYDFVSRFFSPGDGLPEDPVTGSAHTALAPYWAQRLDKTELNAVQASTRGGRLEVAVRGDRVHLTGRAVTVIDGDLRA
jgi:PhzF family phenazine biosynthesis protein